MTFESYYIYIYTFNKNKTNIVQGYYYSIFNSFLDHDSVCMHLL